MNDKKISVIIVGNPDDEHHTYVKLEDKYFEFYTEGYDEANAKNIIRFLKFLGYEVFEVYDNNFYIKPENISNYPY